MPLISTRSCLKRKIWTKCAAKCCARESAAWQAIAKQNLMTCVCLQDGDEDEDEEEADEDAAMQPDGERQVRL